MQPIIRHFWKNLLLALSVYGYLWMYCTEDVCLIELNTKKLKRKGQAKEEYSLINFQEINFCIVISECSNNEIMQ